MEKNKIVRQKNNLEFIVNDTKADKTASKSSIISSGHYSYPDQHRKFSIIGAISRFQKVNDTSVNIINEKRFITP